MKRMLIGVVILIVTTLIFLMSYAIVSIPLEYIIDPLDNSYQSLAENNSWNDATEMQNNLYMLPYYLAGGVLIGIILMVLWFFAYAHKKEYERY